MEHLFTTRVKHNGDGIFDIDLDQLKNELPEGYVLVERDMIVHLEVSYILVGFWCKPDAVADNKKASPRSDQPL